MSQHFAGLLDEIRAQTERADRAERALVAVYEKIYGVWSDGDPVSAFELVEFAESQMQIAGVRLPTLRE